jgi:hypothetical protein
MDMVRAIFSDCKPTFALEKVSSTRATVTSKGNRALHRKFCSYDLMLAGSVPRCTYEKEIERTGTNGGHGAKKKASSQ